LALASLQGQTAGQVVVKEQFVNVAPYAGQQVKYIEQPVTAYAGPTTGLSMSVIIGGGSAFAGPTTGLGGNAIVGG